MRHPIILATFALASAMPAIAQPPRGEPDWRRDSYDTRYADMDAAQRRWDAAQQRFERERDAYEQERLAYDQARARFEQDRERVAAYDGPTWRGANGEVHCRRSDGTTGTIVGGVAGALLGRAIDGGRRSAVGTILGAGAGALAGRAVEQGGRMSCR